MTDDSAITHVSDTAIWVAHYRAVESERADALFHDPFAGLLAGDRGRKIAATMAYPRVMQWIVSIRTIAIDALIRHAISLKVDTVVNLGAGLDTRPYRMNLPAELHWIEVDFSHIIDFKTEKLSNEKPVCRLKLMAADLADVALRRRLHERIGTESRRALILTEGVSPYLANDEAASLSEDLYAVPSFHYWIQEYRRGETRRFTPRRLRRLFKDSPFKFNETDPLAFFMRQGWTILENRFTATEAERVQRPLPMMFPWSLLLHLMPRRVRDKWRTASGYVLYAKPSPAP
jgi:methyltransferase (TIGR00027 family)